MEHSQAQCVGLRERKKLATREALSRAAIELALREGPESVRVPDIVAEAGVSPRTFNNYFSSVPEAICAQVADRARSLGDALRSRPDGEPLVDAIANAMIADRDESEDGKRVLRMMITSPVLRGELFKSFLTREEAFAQAIAERVHAPGDDMDARLLAAAYFGMAREISHRWLSHDDDKDGEGPGILALLDHGLHLLAPAAAGYEARHAKATSAGSAKNTKDAKGETSHKAPQHAA